MALDRFPTYDLVISGGVAANSHLARRIQTLAEERGVRLHIPKKSLCGDNGAMIAVSGCFEYLAGNRADTSLNASALDEM